MEHDLSEAIRELGPQILIFWMPVGLAPGWIRSPRFRVLFGNCPGAAPIIGYVSPPKIQVLRREDVTIVQIHAVVPGLKGGFIEENN